ncbi:PLP-dependent aspartate aminotransferase family protein [Faecalicatena acetigenes]|uniref:PLP-dependent aspartate aminotransferase family protein n=1 Tax=Faecalicatena acetigenes TaxID=2981790 RepID=A0ABT2T9H5_9FIRM|nr:MULTISPECIES: PLP-dependent aspartate aminotransferase family protein [Lachnospiraceae]MCU6746885.1 PLP-dependent aspartate aminotransferase family protein [Faecalicatena acetigenes]RGT72853.1 PLP-dependent transferase [Ruminococcus sp. AF18-22]SCH49298.1 Cystathionine gamma-lyase [uncultured Clostridium sp.]
MGTSEELMPKIDRTHIFEKNKEYEDMDFATRAIDVGNYTDRSAVPIYASVTSGTTYQRNGDPSRDALCANIASLEGAAYTLATASGVSAVTLPILALLNHGERIICHKDLYLWTYFFVREDLPRLLNADVVMVDMTKEEELEKELKKGGTKLILSETVTNPMLEVIDLKRCSELAHQYGAKHINDNTFASPYLCRPLELGCDVVCESATKYINGHGDALGGAISTNEHEIYYKLQRMMGELGPCLSPFGSFLIMRGIQTLPMRMERHCDNAEKLAAYLAAKPFVKNLIYPGLAEHPQHELAKKQLKRFGGMLCFQLDVDHETLHEKFIPELKLFKHWVSLGEAHSLISPKDADDEKGIPADLIRVSVGLEDVSDLIDDLENSFKKIGL